MSTAIYVFRQDLRLSDNPALAAACQHDAVIPVYILDEENAGDHKMGAASKWWLHHSLQALNQSLDGKLSFRLGDSFAIILQLAKQHQVNHIYWNRCYEPWRVAVDTQLKKRLLAEGFSVASHNSALLWEPWQIKKADGNPYQVFTPFYRKGCLNAELPRMPLPAPQAKSWVATTGGVELDALRLLPKIRWYQALAPHWEIGEAGAQKRFAEFIEDGLTNYKEGRNLPAKPFVSRLSPHLHFGEISPHQLWYEVMRANADLHNIAHFRSELGWREFAYSQLFYNPELPKRNQQTKFDRFPWATHTEGQALTAWQTGQTGIPMVDAGMRELWQTGYMHNRVRMITGSFLVKNLLIHWREGERWFWDTLVDADLANNSASWQWVAGCGADAAPYFRIFNPVTQGQKFDPEGDYVRRFIPELALLPNKYLFNPWEAPKAVLAEAQVTLGTTYTRPIVDLKDSRRKALDAFQALA